MVKEGLLVAAVLMEAVVGDRVIEDESVGESILQRD